MLIQEREIIKRIPVYVKRGRNAGRKTGTIYFERNKSPFYYITKNFKSEQMMRNPKHIGELPISTDIIEELKKYEVKNVIFMIIGFDDAGSFYIIVPLKDYDNARGYSYDDPQKFVYLREYPRIYPEQGSLSKFEGVWWGKQCNKQEK